MDNGLENQGFESPYLQSRTLSALSRLRSPQRQKATSLTSIHQPGELRLGKPAFKMATFFYVYVLQSHDNAERFYTGLTGELRPRVSACGFCATTIMLFHRKGNRPAPMNRRTRKSVSFNN